MPPRRISTRFRLFPSPGYTRTTKFGLIGNALTARGRLLCATGGCLLLIFSVLTQPGRAGAGKTKIRGGAPPRPGMEASLSNVTFVAFDTETTGFSGANDRVVEIGVIKFKDGHVLERKSWLVNPGRKIPSYTLKVHGISDDMVANEPTFKEAYPKFKAFIEGSVLLAHNARFDISFIREEALRNDLSPPPNEVIDSLSLFRKWFPNAESHSLEGLAEHLELEPNEFHRAVADSMMIYEILSVGMRRNPTTRTLGELQKSAGGAMKF